jgi:ATP-dependent Lon protease
VGVVASVLQLLKLPDGTVRVLVEGQSRAKLGELKEEADLLMAQVEPIEPVEAEGAEVAAMMRSVVDQFGEYTKLNKKLSRTRAISSATSRMPASWPIGRRHISAKVADKQALLSRPIRSSGWRWSSASWKASWACCRWSAASVAA